MESTRSRIVPASIALAVGVLSWEIVVFLGEHREAWDDPLYWQLGYPMLVIAAFVLGLTWRAAPWRWVAWMMAGQAGWSLLLAVLGGGMPNLFPLGLLTSAVLALPCLAAAYAGQWLANRTLD